MQLQLMKEMLASGGVSDFGEAEADFAAYLFCRIGRPKNVDHRLAHGLLNRRLRDHFLSTTRDR